MRTTLLVTLFLTLCMASAGLVRADLLTGGAVYQDSRNFVNNGTSSSAYLSPMRVNNLTTGQNMITFCGDFLVTTSPAFSGGAGQAYTSGPLATASIYSNSQRRMINDLFTYTYASAFNTETGAVTNQVLAQTMQLVIWEILTESTSTYALNGGSFYGTNLTTTMLNDTNSFFRALNGEIAWSSINSGFVANNTYDMTVYVAQGGVNASQTQISVTAPRAATPEPASMMIFGTGIAAAIPMLRRRMSKKSK